MGQAKKRGTREERIAQAMLMREPEQFFGYDSAALMNRRLNCPRTG